MICNHVAYIMRISCYDACDEQSRRQRKSCCHYVRAVNELLQKAQARLHLHSHCVVYLQMASMDGSFGFVLEEQCIIPIKSHRLIVYRYSISLHINCS